MTDAPKIEVKIDRSEKPIEYPTFIVKGIEAGETLEITYGYDGKDVQLLARSKKDGRYLVTEIVEDGK